MLLNNEVDCENSGSRFEEEEADYEHNQKDGIFHLETYTLQEILKDARLQEFEFVAGGGEVPEALAGPLVAGEGERREHPGREDQQRGSRGRREAEADDLELVP